MSFVHKYRCRNRSSSTLKRIAKITQVIDSRLWHENIEELTISKKLKRKNHTIHHRRRTKPSGSHYPSLFSPPAAINSNDFFKNVNVKSVNCLLFSSINYLD